MVRSTSLYGVWVGGSRYHGQRAWGAQGALVCVWLMVSGFCAQAESVKPLSEFKDTIIARAEEAWESDNGEVMFIRGDLQLRGSHWRIHADTARVEGKFGDLARVVVDGNPARIIVTGNDQSQPLEGRSQHLDFDPRANLMRLEGAATIVKGKESISSESIRYSLDRRTFEAGTHGRVKVVTSPHARRE
jgi:lipopolysaccharide transport protein LptA